MACALCFHDLLHFFKVSLWRRLSHRDIDHRFRTEGPAPSRRVNTVASWEASPADIARRLCSLSGRALQAQAKPGQHVASAMAVLRVYMQQGCTSMGAGNYQERRGS